MGSSSLQAPSLWPPCRLARLSENNSFGAIRLYSTTKPRTLRFAPSVWNLRCRGRRECIPQLLAYNGPRFVVCQRCLIKELSGPLTILVGGAAGYILSFGIRASHPIDSRLSHRNPLRLAEGCSVGRAGKAKHEPDCAIGAKASREHEQTLSRPTRESFSDVGDHRAVLAWAVNPGSGTLPP